MASADEISGNFESSRRRKWKIERWFWENTGRACGPSTRLQHYGEGAGSAIIPDAVKAGSNVLCDAGHSRRVIDADATGKPYRN